jgi:hypothetical protein
MRVTKPWSTFATVCKRRLSEIGCGERTLRLALGALPATLSPF